VKKVIVLKLLALIMFVSACADNDPRKVSGYDAGQILSTEIGTIIDVQSVIIRGKESEWGATLGAIAGGIAGAIITDGEKQEVREILITTGAIVGGVIGYYLPVKLGEHNGFQYVITIDEKHKPLTVIQGATDSDDEGFKVGQRVTVVFGEKVRVLPGKV